MELEKTKQRFRLIIVNQKCLCQRLLRGVAEEGALGPKPPPPIISDVVYIEH